MSQEPEILPPRPEVVRVHDAQLELLARLLDDIFRIPGTNLRFGLDALLGIFPGFGDALTGAMSAALIVSAWQRGLPRVTILRMIANVAIDSVLGSVPVLGDVFDFAWKSNRMNYELLQREIARPRRQRLADWGFLLLAIVVVAALAAAPFVLLVWLGRALWQ